MPKPDFAGLFFPVLSRNFILLWHQHRRLNVQHKEHHHPVAARGEAGQHQWHSRELSSGLASGYLPLYRSCSIHHVCFSCWEKPQC